MSFLTVFSAVSSFFQATWSVTWKRRLLIASGFLACLAIGFSVGRFALPARVEVREVEKVVTKVETKIEWKERIVVEKQKAQTKVVYIDRVIEGGRTTEKVTETTTTKEDTHATKDKDKKQEDKVEQWREKLVTKIVTNQPRWRVGVDVGLELAHAQGEHLRSADCRRARGLPHRCRVRRRRVGEYLGRGGCWIVLLILRRSNARR